MKISTKGRYAVRVMLDLALNNSGECIKVKEIAGRHGEAPETIIYAWLMYHPVGAVPLSGSNKLERLDLAVKALDVKLEHYEWYEIYVASGQQVLR